MMWNFAATVSHYKATVMGEIIPNERVNKISCRGRRRSAHNSRVIRIDMTPMVDLGFLLVTFFIFTTEISKPAVTNLYMPHDDDSTATPGSRSLTTLLGANNKVFYYFGTTQRAISDKLIFETSYDELSGLGKIIRQKQNELEKIVAGKELVVLIKSGTHASYKNVVDALDEMLINNVKHYALSDPDPQESVYLDRY